MGSVRGLVTHVGGGTHQAKMRSAPDGKWERLEGTWQELVERLNGVVCNLRMTVQEGVYTMRNGVSRGYICVETGKKRAEAMVSINSFRACGTENTRGIWGGSESVDFYIYYSGSIK